MVVLDVQYNGTIVALSTGIAFIGAFAAVSLCEQYRLSTTSTSSRNSLLLMAFVAFSLGGVGIWCMHFNSVASFRLNNRGVDVPIRYNLTMLIITLVVVSIFEFVGLYCASTDSCFNKSKKEIMEMFIARASNKYSMSEIKQMGKFKILSIVCTHSPERILIGGVIAGGGVAIMHYLGMMCMEFQGTIKYNAGLVALSVIVAILAVIGGFWIFFRVLSLFPSLDILRVACALNGMFSLSGVHYIGLVSATYDYDPEKEPPNTSNTIDSQQLLIGVLAASVIFCAIMQVYVMSDLRSWLLRTSTQLRQADIVVNTLRKQTGKVKSPTASSSATSRELFKYLSKYYKYSAGDTDTDNMSVVLYNDYSDEEVEEDEDMVDNNNTNHHTNRGGTAGEEQSAHRHALKDEERGESAILDKSIAKKKPRNVKNAGEARTPVSGNGRVVPITTDENFTNTQEIDNVAATTAGSGTEPEAGLLRLESAESAAKTDEMDGVEQHIV